jgi:hypothetical protein
MNIAAEMPHLEGVSSTAALITGLALIVVQLITSIFNLIQSKKNFHHMNGRMEQLLESVRHGAYERGKMDGIQEEKAKHVMRLERRQQERDREAEGDREK